MIKALDMFFAAPVISRLDLGIDVNNDATDYTVFNDGWNTLINYGYVDYNHKQVLRSFVFPKTYIMMHFKPGTGFLRRDGLSGYITKFDIGANEIRASAIGDIFINAEEINSYIVDIVGAALVAIFSGREFHEELEKAYPFYDIK